MLTAPNGAVALERALGDPYDSDNPLGFAATVGNDERGEISAAGEELLDRLCLNAEFVPVALGGRLHAIDELVRAVRPVMRRDATLGLGYGITSFMAAINLWVAGTAAQRARIAELLLSGAKVSVAYHELDHGNDFSRNEFRAQVAGDRIELDGRKQVINNIERAAAMVLFARTGPGAGSRSHSVIFADKVELDPARVRYLGRYRSVGVRGCQLGGIELASCELPADSVVGELGHGVEIALRSFQITRAALPGMALGSLDTALRTVLRFARSRQLYGTTVADLPHARATLAGVFADLLACDCLATAAARALHVVPEQAGSLAAATKYLVPRIISEALYELSIVLGARSYIREGEHAIFQKIARDTPVLGVGHASAGACLATLVPQLTALARRAWGRDEDPPAALFDRDYELAALAPTKLGLGAAHRDAMICGVGPALDELDSACASSPTARELAAKLRAAKADLQTDAAALAPKDRTSFGSADAFELGHRYAVLVAASACLGTWRTERSEPHAFASDPAFVLASLQRLVGRLTRSGPLDAELEAPLFAELQRRDGATRSFDLDDLPLYGSDHA